MSKSKLCVYLSGGFKAPNWRDFVIEQVPEAEYKDPRSSGMKEPEEYTAWNKDAIAHSDCVFAYLEGENPFGWNTAFEAGYAVGFGVPVIFINDDASRDRYTSMIAASSQASFRTLEEGVAFLKEVIAYNY
jgi:nucleoside 2-deoxyribosyltransferase